MKIPRLYLIIAVFVFNALPFFAQQRNIDSLLTLLAKDKNDTLKVQHLNAISMQYTNARLFDSTVNRLNASFELSTQIIKDNNNTTNQIYRTAQRGIALAHHISGIANYYQGNYEKALENYAASLKINIAINNKKAAANGTYIPVGTK